MSWDYVYEDPIEYRTLMASDPDPTPTPTPTDPNKIKKLKDPAELTPWEEMKAAVNRELNDSTPEPTTQPISPLPHRITLQPTQQPSPTPTPTKNE